MNAFYDLTWRAVLRLTGRDRARFLHGMCTNEIKKLQPGQGCMAAIINRQGKMTADIIVRATDDSLLLETDRSNQQHAVDALNKFLVADDVKVEPADFCVLAVSNRLAPHLGAAPPPELFHFVRSGDLLLSTDPLPMLVTVLLPPAKRDETLRRLVEFGGEGGSSGDYDVLRILHGFPRWGVDMGPDVLPMEAGLEPIAISYTKGCYIGQEVIQRVKTYSEPPTMLVQLKVASASPGDAISSGGQEIGTVTSANAAVALGYVRKEYKKAGTEVTVAGHPAVVQALPWQARLT